MGASVGLGGSSNVIVIDAGSSGTRLNAFELTRVEDLDRYSRKRDVGIRIQSKDGGYSYRIEQIKPEVAKDRIPQRKTEQRRAYQRVETEPGLASFGESLDMIEEKVMRPLFDWVKAVIPQERWKETPVFLFGTAGMRRLSSAEQGDILAECRRILSSSGFLFRDDWARVIRGADEGVYGWAALNAVEDRLSGGDTLGALDLGGSSLEVTFEVKDDDKGMIPLRIGGRTYHLYTYSHGHAGLDDAFQRSLQILEENPSRVSLVENKAQLRHPCIHKGFKSVVKRMPLDDAQPMFQEVEVLGAPDGEECDLLAEQVVESVHPCHKGDTGCSISSIHPKFDGNFAAMSGFYVVNHFYGLSPKALLDDVRETTDSFCSLEWNKVVERHEGELAVETYCFRGEYVEALLLNGLRLSDAKVRLGYESPGWPLGAALVEGANAIPAMTHHAQLKRVKTSLLFSGLLVCIVGVFLASRVWQYSLMAKVARKVDRMNRRKLARTSSKSIGPSSSSAALSMEKGDGLWQQGNSQLSLSRSQTFSRKLNALDGN
ncbi:hypothetical protein M9434_005660 [Picochlorum sp. BPE23]|nr:hypothetical protein M9434_005660 [Picochlorum sp. BPE23]